MRRKVEPAELRLGDRRARRAAAPALVEEAELLERDRGRERDDHEADPADTEGRHGDEEADDRGRRRSDEERDRELRPDAPDVGRQVRHREARDTGERELHDGDLADEADDDDEREADHDAEQRVDQGLPEVEREGDQAGDADDARRSPSA